MLKKYSGKMKQENRQNSSVILCNEKQFDLTEKINFVFKGSFDKANRTSVNGTRGVGLSKGLQMLSTVKEKIITDFPQTEFS